MKKSFFLVFLFLAFSLLSLYSQENEVSSVLDGALRAGFEKDYEGLDKYIDFDSVLLAKAQKIPSLASALNNSEQKKNVVKQFKSKLCSITQSQYEAVASSPKKIQIDSKDPRYAEITFKNSSEILVVWRFEKRKSGWVVIDINEAENSQTALVSQKVVELKQKAVQGDVNAQFDLACCYKNGLDVAKDTEEATNWYKKAVTGYLKIVEQGDPKVLHNLGFCYFNGLGVLQDYKESFKCYQKAAESGDTDSQYALGICYEKGQGCSQDFILAHMWYNLSSISGDEFSRESREDLEKKMTPDQIQKAQDLARNWQPKKSN